MSALGRLAGIVEQIVAYPWVGADDELTGCVARQRSDEGIVGVDRDLHEAHRGRIARRAEAA